ncbi:MAG: FliH/SctL family protein [Polyangiales bacterium]
MDRAPGVPPAGARRGAARRPPVERAAAAREPYAELRAAAKPASLPPPPAPVAPIPPPLPDTAPPGAPVSLEPPLPQRDRSEPETPREDPREAEILVLHDALDELRKEHDALRGHAMELEGRFGQYRREVLAESEGQLLRLALAIAERVVARELRTDPTLIARWAADALGALAAVSADLRPSLAVGAATSALVPEDAWAELLGDVRVERDPALPPLGCELRAGFSAVDVSPAQRLGALRSELLGDLDGGPA